MNQIKNNLASLIQSAFGTLLIVSMVFGFGSNAFAASLPRNATHKWNRSDKFTKLS